LPQKTISVSEENYNRLLFLLADLIKENKQIKSFDDVITYLLEKAGVE